MSTEAVMREFYFNCNNCGQKLSCDASMLGEDVACPVCGNIIHLESNKHIQECAATNKVQK